MYERNVERQQLSRRRRLLPAVIGAICALGFMSQPSSSEARPKPKAYPVEDCLTKEFSDGNGTIKRCLISSVIAGESTLKKRVITSKRTYQKVHDNGFATTDHVTRVRTKSYKKDGSIKVVFPEEKTLVRLYAPFDPNSAPIPKLPSDVIGQQPISPNEPLIEMPPLQGNPTPAQPGTVQECFDDISEEPAACTAEVYNQMIECYTADNIWRNPSQENPAGLCIEYDFGVPASINMAALKQL